MGTIAHNAIVVTGWDDHIRAAHQAAIGIGCTVSGITEEVTNGYRSFLVAPDGSKEGWQESATGDTRRHEFRDWLRANRDKVHCDWVEVRFSPDYGDASVVDSSTGAALAKAEEA